MFYFRGVPPYMKKRALLLMSEEILTFFSNITLGLLSLRENKQGRYITQQRLHI